MCEVCGHIDIQVNARRFDPTRTTSLRNAFSREMRVRFNRIARLIQKAVVEEDVFGLNIPSPDRRLNVQVGTPGHNAFNFTTSQAKVNGFLEWLKAQEEAGLLSTTTASQAGTGIQQAWTDRYITDSYKRGVQRARYELSQAGFDVPPMDGSSTFNISGPFHVDRLGILHARVFQDLRGITAQMDQMITRVLTQGLADGDNPRLLARKLVATINGSGAGELGLTNSIGRFIPARRRAEILARTEIVRAHHQATIQEYQNWGSENVVVKAEWMTAGDNRVCSRCIALEGEVFTLEEVRNMIPLHPQCRCVALPFRGQ